MGARSDAGRLTPESTGGSRFAGAQTWSAHRRAHSRLCRHDGHTPGAATVADGWTMARARAVVSCTRCGAYMASFEGPLTAVRTATAQWMHRATD